MKDIPEIERLIAETERELAFPDSKRSLLLKKLKDFKAERDSITETSFNTSDVFQKAPIENHGVLLHRDHEKNLPLPSHYRKR